MCNIILRLTHKGNCVGDSSRYGTHSVLCKVRMERANYAQLCVFHVLSLQNVVNDKPTNVRL